MNNPRPKILMVIQHFRPLVGGAEKQAERLAQTLHKDGVEVDIVTGQWASGHALRESTESYELFRLFCFYNFWNLRFIKRLGQLCFLVHLFIFILVRRKHYQLIHVHQALKPAAVAAFSARLCGLPCLAKSGSSGVTSDSTEISKGLLGPLFSYLFRKNINRIVCTSELGYKEYRKQGYSEEKLTRIPNGICVPDPMQQWRKGKDIPTFLYVGRLSNEKGVDILVRSVHEALRSSDYRFQLRIVGTGPETENIRKLIEELNLSETITLAGHSDDPTTEYLQADYFALPSRSEGMSNALLEAISFGLPCVATRVGSNAEVLPHMQAGIIVDPESPEALAKGLLTLVSDGVAWSRPQIVEWCRSQFSIESVSARYRQLYQSLIANQSSLH